MKISIAHKAHPWHGIAAGENAPAVVTAFIEIVPTDTVKYEIDKTSGWLKVDRPQNFAVGVPALYGFVPQTYCDQQVAIHCMVTTGLQNIQGDRDPLDILVLTEKNISNGGVLVQAIPIGGLLMIDKNEADDKIIAVLKDDAVYGHLTHIEQLNEKQLNKLKHYFLTYKDMPGTSGRTVEIATVYGPEEARSVISKSMEDYSRSFNPSSP